MSKSFFQPPTLSGRRDRGLVLPLCLILLACVLVVALSVSSEVGLNLRIADNESQGAQLDRIAAAGVEQALYVAASVPNWRHLTADLGPNEPLLPAVAFAGGAYSVYVSDPDSPDLVENPIRPLFIRSVGTLGGATRTVALRACPPVHEAVTFVAFSGAPDRDLILTDGVTIHGAVRTHRGLSTSGITPVLDNDIYAPATASLPAALLDADTAHVICTKSVPLPQPDFDWFLTRAAPPAARVNAVTLTDAVLSPSSNPYGLTHPDGLYYIDALGQIVRMTHVYLRGTLIIRNAAEVLIKGAFVHKPVRPDYPAVLCDSPVGGLIFEFWYPLIEADQHVDFNQDGDQTDVFPCELNGVIYSTGYLEGFTLSESSNAVTVTGAIVGSWVRLRGRNVVIHQDLGLITNRVVGFQGTGLVRERGSVVTY